MCYEETTTRIAQSIMIEYDCTDCSLSFALTLFSASEL